MKKSLLLFLTLVITQLLFAQTIHYVQAGGSGDGTSWGSASGDLQAMLSAAQSGDQIWVAAGTYTPTNNVMLTDISFVLKNGVAIYGGFAGGETQLSQRNWQTNVTILSGELQQDDNIYNNSFHVVQGNSGTDKTAILDGFTIKGGNGDANFPHDSGAGMFNDHSSPTLNNCTFSGNRSLGDGAGMYNTSSSPTLTNCTFLENRADGFAGGMYNNNSSNPTLTNCTFSGNYASMDGGGMYNNNSSNPTLTNCTFSGNNTGSNGGGMSNESSSPTLTNCILWGDSRGEIYNLSGSPTVTYSIIQGGYSGTGNKDQDPLFVSATDLHLQACSAAIDAGNDAANTTTTDLDGNQRKVRTIDMGAYEYQGTVAPTINTQPQPTQSVCQNSTPTALTVGASGAGLTYQWYSNSSNSNSGGTTITNATTNSYTPSTATVGTVYYYVEVSNACGTMVTSNVAAVTVNVCGSCGNATNLTTINITSSSATLNWVAGVNPAQWQLQYKSTAPGSKWIDVTITPSARSVILSGLKAKQNYMWHIRAKCSNSWTAYSDAVSFTTLKASLITTIQSLEIETLQVQALPNPSTTQFTLRVHSTNLKDRVTLRVMDAVGRTLELKTVSAGETVQIGASYMQGTYFAQAVQGSSSITVKLVKE